MIQPDRGKTVDEILSAGGQRQKTIRLASWIFSGIPAMSDGYHAVDVSRRRQRARPRLSRKIRNPLPGSTEVSATILWNCIFRYETSSRSADRSTDTMTLTPQAVFLEHESWLRTVVRSRVQESEAVEDIMQNIALALVRQRDTLKEIGQLGAWLYQVAVRQVMM